MGSHELLWRTSCSRRFPSQPRVLPRRRAACNERKHSWLRASSIASEEAGVSSSEAASSMDEIGLDVLTPRRSLNRLIKGCAACIDDDAGMRCDVIDFSPFSHSAHSLLEIRALVIEHALDFDAANLAHALGRVAKHYRSATTRAGLDAAQQPSDDRKWNQFHEAAIPAVQKLCEQLPRLVHEMEAWDVAQSLWALSILDCYDRRVFEMLSHRGGQIAALLKPIDCCMIMLAFGRFGHYSPGE
jgi:hypothetical protein